MESQAYPPKEFEDGDLVLPFNSRLKLFPGRLCSRWLGPFKVKKVFLCVAIEVRVKATDTFKMN